MPLVLGNASFRVWCSPSRKSIPAISISCTGSAGIDLVLDNEHYQLRLTIRFRMAYPKLRAFNLTCRIDPGDEDSLSGLVSADRRRRADFQLPRADGAGARLFGLVGDPRSEYAGAWDVPGTTLLTAMPDDAVIELGLDAHSAVVALTHDPKLDDLALLEALKSPAFCVGALGSRTTNSRRRKSPFRFSPR